MRRDVSRHRPAGPAPEASAAAAPPSPPAAFGELRRLSGLTWDQLAGLFEVDRRSLHFWASGKPMNACEEEKLHGLLGVLRTIDRGSAAANRAALLGEGESGDPPFDLLVRGEYDAVAARLGAGKGRRVVHASPSAAEMARRAPRPPGELVGALQDRIHPASGRLLSATSLGDGRKQAVARLSGGR